MKNRFYGLLAFFTLFIAGLATSAWYGSSSETLEVREVTPAGEFQSTGTTFYEFTYTKDTILNAANDTLYLPSRLRPALSDFVLAYSITRTQLSGTISLAVKVEESTYRYTGTTPPTLGWVASLNSANAAAATVGTGATEEEIRLANTFGTSYRVIVDGTGTQSSSYTLRLVMKRKE